MKPELASRNIVNWTKSVSVIPVLVVDDVAKAQPLALALLQGGLNVLEVTLRTNAALNVIEQMAILSENRENQENNESDLIIAAGTVLNEQDVKDAKQAGASFIVSPGATPAIIEAAEKHDIALLPGAVTSSEIMTLNEYGFNLLKFFPAEASGGIDVVKAFGGPFPQVKFCPTGGIGAHNYGQYLVLKNVICVGGSWIASSEEIASNNWSSISDKAKHACV